ncbi:urease accessory UreF family protein [Kitasatospora sp. NPDC049285]|uniref:urease accessory protein UreF n=1 Tax=Kitasatospora sp. NPDC049285 TaxID=3157096 RepID=UPI003424DCC6
MQRQESTAAPTGSSPGRLGALLLLADPRLPTGAHAHSGGVEAAVRAGRVRDTAELAQFLTGRLHTAGLTAAGLAAAAATADGDAQRLRELDAEADARTPSAAARATSRKLGRQLLRAAAALWPGPELRALTAADPQQPVGPHQPVVLGAVAGLAGLTATEAAGLAAYESVNGPAAAGVRLLGLDPYEVAAVLAQLTPQVDELAAAAVRAVERGELPASGSPLLEIYAEQHAARKGRLFAS